MTTTILTPYRALHTVAGDRAPQQLIPEWAHKRSVFRAGHATYYVVETQDIASAKSDLDTLATLGWNVDVHPLGLDGSARITMHAREVQHAA